jgi:hypothetical protein
LFSGESRARFTSLLGLDEATWVRGRGWALWKALLQLAAERTRPGSARRAARRFGWRCDPAELVSDLIGAHRQTR